MAFAFGNSPHPRAIAFGGDGVLIGLSDSRFLGIAAFAHTAIMALALFLNRFVEPEPFGNLGSPGSGWSSERSVTARSRVLLR